MCMCMCTPTQLCSDSLLPHRQQPASLLCPWDFPGKNAGVGCHFLLQWLFPTNQGLDPSLWHHLHLQADSLHQPPGKVKVKSLSCVRLSATPWTVARQALLSMGFSRPKYWNGQPFPSPGDLPNPGTEPRSPSLQADSLPAEPQRKPLGSRQILKFLHLHPRFADSETLEAVKPCL